MYSNNEYFEENMGFVAGENRVSFWKHGCSADAILKVKFQQLIEFPYTRKPMLLRCFLWRMLMYIPPVIIEVDGQNVMESFW